MRVSAAMMRPVTCYTSRYESWNATRMACSAAGRTRSDSLAHSRGNSHSVTRGEGGTWVGSAQAASRSCWAKGVSCSLTATRQRVRMAAGLQAQRAPAEAPDRPSSPYTAIKMSRVVSVIRQRA